MSKKKEKRIKRLRKYSLWPQFIEAFIVEVATDNVYDKKDVESLGCSAYEIALTTNK